MGGGGGPNPQDPAGIGGSRAGLESDASHLNLPGWAAGDTFDSWLTRLPGGGAPSSGVGESMAKAQPGANAAPEPTTMAALGAAPAAGNRPPEYAAGTGNRSEAVSRAAVEPMRPTTPIAGAPAPAGKTAEQLAAEAKAKGEEWVSAGGMPAGFFENPANLAAAQLAGKGTYNFGGVYTPNNISQTNYNQFQQGMGTPVGQTLTGADAENQPRMRRSLYDFNMANYGTPYAPGKFGFGTTQEWMSPNSFLMGGGG